jgi:NitT/TauT family transport system ATP-binding protein
MKVETLPLLVTHHLNHDYSGVQVLVDINLEVQAGERLVVLGPSGCGKTSLLRIIGGLMPASTGEVLMGAKAPVAGKDTALVFQRSRLLPWRRANANINLVLQHQSQEQCAQRVRDLLGQVGLQDHAEKWPHELSGGMQQRLALARALAMDVSLLLLDEPFANLDPLSREEMQQVLLDLSGRQQERSIALILVTHSVEEALAIGDRILLMSGAPGHVLKEFRPGLCGDVLQRRADPTFYAQLLEISNELRHAR